MHLQQICFMYYSETWSHKTGSILCLTQLAVVVGIKEQQLLETAITTMANNHQRHGENGQ